MRVTSISIAVVLVSQICSAQPPVVSPLQTQNHRGGSGCSFWIAPKSTDDLHVFEWNLQKDAWINAAESDVQLGLTESSVERIDNDPPSVGDRWLRRFAGNGIVVTLNTETTALCPPDQKECESWSEEGVLRVTIGDETAIVPVTGSCGS